MITSTIKFSQIEDRIDAEYYKPEFLEVQKILKSFKNIKLLDDLVDKMMYGTSDDIEYTRRGIPLLRITDFDNSSDEIDTSDLKYVPDFLVNRIYKKYQLKKNDLLFSRSGTVGLVALIDDKLKGSIFGSYFIKIPLKQNLVNPVYLYLFLNSYYGRVQSQRLKIGAIQTNIALPQISSIKILIPSQSFQQKIEKMVKKAQKKRGLADKKYKEAEKILNKELGLENLDLSAQKTFETNFSGVKDRFDTEYYQPKYKKIISKLKSQKTKSLNEIMNMSNKKLEPMKNPSAEIRYIELANINNSSGVIENCKTYKHWQLPGRAKMLIKNGDVLISSLGGSIDKVGLITGEYNNQVASTGFFVVNSNILNSETLFLIFRNRIINSQLEQNTRGAIMSAISGNEFKNILIPILPKSTQQKISPLIQESFRLRKKARELIKRAKEEVEAAVEEK